MFNYLGTPVIQGAMFVCLFGLSSVLHAASAPTFVGNDLGGKPCGGDYQGYGPFDYMERNHYSKELKKVEDFHFTRDVEFLIRGSTSTTPYKDLAYTLRAWPNHHRALNAISKYQIRLKRIHRSIPIAAECWFQRAVVFNPKDSTTYLLYGIYLQKNGQLELAKANYDKALELKPNDVQTHYNLGLLLVQQKKYAGAKQHAKIAYDSSFPLPGLKNQLKELGYWP